MKSKKNRSSDEPACLDGRHNPPVPALEALRAVHPAVKGAHQWLTGEGEMMRRIREFDWSKTALGPLSLWPASLRAATSICLNSRYPMFIAWGADRSMLYNDAYIAVLAGKHPGALGRPAEEVWREIWHILGPHWARVFDQGEATWAEDLLLLMNRSGYDEETYFTFSYSPIRDEGGSLGGMFCACQESTEKIVGERRLKTLRELAAQAAMAKSAQDAYVMAMKTLSGNRLDVPFILLYLVDGDRCHASLAGAAGLDADGPASPSSIALDGEDPHGWPLGQVLREGTARSAENLPDRFGPLPSGPWTQPTTRALLLPIRLTAQEKPSAILIAGVSPVRPLDEGYRTFLEVAAGQIASAIANALAYEQERQRAEALAELDRAKTAFFSNVSHEFRTPLTLMLGPVEDLLSRSHTDLSPAAKGQLEVVNRNGLRLLRLVNTLLDFSRIEAGRVQAVFEPTDLAAFTTELASVFRAATERAGLSLIVDCPKLPEPVYADRDMWEKIVLNLVSNAFKFTFEGQIEVKLHADSSHAVLTVRDTGVGIPAEEMPRLFERFHRVQNMRSRTHEGSGIGLALVQELVKLHGGSIRAESHLGEGTTFIITVPLGHKHLPPDRLGGSRTLASTAVGAAPFVEEALRWLPEVAPMGETAQPAPHDELMPIPCPSGEGEEVTGRPLVLIADDNADMRHYLARLLNERYNVQMVPDGQAALAAARENRPDLVLSDVMMPNLDGFGLVRELRADAALQTIPIILLSARAGEESRVEGLQQGADDYLIKPFSARELMARVAAHLEMARMRQEAAVQIRQSEERVRLIARAARIGFFEWNVAKDTAYWSPEHYELFGYEPGSPITWERWLQDVHPEDRERVVQNARRLLERGRAEGQVRGHKDEYRFVRADGSVRWLESDVSLDLAGDEAIVRGSVRDITERKRAEEALQQAYGRLKTFFDVRLGGIGILIARADGSIVQTNDYYLDMLGHTRQEFEGGQVTWIERTPPEWLPADERALTQLRERGACDPYEKEYVRRDGTRVPVLITDVMMPGPEKDILAIVVNMTERKKAEEALRQWNATLESKVAERTAELQQRARQLAKMTLEVSLTEDRERKRMAEILHDDLQQIIAGAKFHVSLLKNRVKYDASLQDIAAQIDGMLKEAVEKSRGLSHELSPAVLYHGDFAETLDWLAQQMQTKHGLVVHAHANGQSHLQSEAIQSFLYKAAQELLFNVVKHAQVNEAGLRFRQHGKYACLSISDRGRGFDPQGLREAAGFGLLSIQERIELLGGRMKIKSAKGKGSTFSIVVPDGKTDGTASPSHELPEAAIPDRSQIHSD